MRMWWGMLAFVLAGSSWAADTQYQRGEFSFSVGDVPAFVQWQDVPAQWDAGAPGTVDTPWRYWLYDVQSDHRRGQHAYYAEHVFEARSNSMLGEAGRFQISFSPSYQQLKIHRVELRRNGQWQARLAPERISLARRESEFEQDMADGQVTALIVLDDVRVDDVVRVSYTVTGSNPVLAGNTLELMPMRWQSPVLDLRMRALYDAGTDVAVSSQNGAPDAEVGQWPDRVEAKVQAHAMPAYVNEGGYPNWYRPYPFVQAAQRRTWGDVVQWALPLYPQVGPLPADLEARIAQWRALGREQQLTQALRTVQQQVRYFGVEMGENSHRPTAPAETWTRRYGDCKDKAYLLVTVLSRLGIKAEPALVSAARGRAVSQYLPAASAFDHVIVRVRLGADTVWVDPTLTSEGGDATSSDQSGYGFALPIANGAAALQAVERPRAAHAAVKVDERYVPSADGRDATLQVSTVYEGGSANDARRSFAKQRLDEVSRRYADYYRQRFGEVEVVQPPTLDDDPVSNRLTLVEHYRLLKPFENDGANRALDLYAETLSKLTQMPQTITRNGPLEVGGPVRYVHRMQVELPPQWNPRFSAEDQRFASAGFDYRRRVRLEGAHVEVVYDLKLLQPDIAVGQVPHHVDELRKLRDGLSARLRFKVPAQQQRDDRDTRLKALLRDAIEESSTP